MKHRIFIAIPLSEKLQKEILAWEDLWRKRLGSRIRWLAGKNLHLTLIPPWYEEDVDGATLMLKTNVRPSMSDNIGLNFYRVQYGPNPRRPRLIWAIGKPAPVIENVKRRLEGLFDQKSENRPWLPHLTIARFREEDFPAFPIKMFDEKIMWREKIKSIVLMESRLSRERVEYEPIAEIDL